MRGFAFFILALFAFVVSLNKAQADVYVWQHPKTGVQASFPDDWMRLSVQKTDEILAIIGPDDEAYPVCRLRVRDDQRFAIYPPRLSGDIQKIALNEDFWKSYLGEYDILAIHQVTDGAGLGRGAASYAASSFDTPIHGPQLRRTGIAFASLYNNQIYILDCSAAADHYDQWQPYFLSIAKGIEMKKGPHELFTGNYRNFLGEGGLLLPSEDKKAYSLY